MSWCRAVWLEGSVEEELTIPSVWVEGSVNEKQFVRWPNGINVLKACKQQAIPQNDWFCFPLLKEKCRHNDKAVCEGFDFTSEESEAPSSKIKLGQLTHENKKGTKYQKIHKMPVCPEKPMFVRARSRSPYSVSSLQNPSVESLAIPELESGFKQPISKLYGSKSLTQSQSIIPTSSKSCFTFLSPAVKSTCQSQLSSSVKSKIPVRQLSQPRSSILVNQPSSQASQTSQVMMPPVNAARNTKTSMSRFPLSEAKFQYKVIHLLTQILEEQCKIGTHYEPEHSLYHVQQFDNLEEFERFDEELSDVAKSYLLKRRLTMVGGMSCHANVKAILLKLMTNKLMASYNMEGKNKKAFKKTNVIRVIVDSMPKYTLNEVHQAIGNVLKRAPDRKDGGGRGCNAEDQDLF